MTFDPHSPEEMAKPGSMIEVALAHARLALIHDPAYAPTALEAIEYYLEQMVRDGALCACGHGPSYHTGGSAAAGKPACLSATCPCEGFWPEEEAR